MSGPGKEFVVLVRARNVVIMRHHAEQRRLAESPRAQEEKILGTVQIALEPGPKRRLVDVERTPSANVCKVGVTLRKTHHGTTLVSASGTTVSCTGTNRKQR